MNISLPNSIVSSDNFSILNENQRAGFIARLSLLDEILRESVSWLAKKEGEFIDFADNLELDLSAVALTNLGDTENQVSPYFVHSTWKFDARGALSIFLRDEVRDRLDQNIFSFNSSEDDVSNWFLDEITIAISLFDDFINSESFDRALACLIAIDGFVSRLLAALVKFRIF